MENNSMEQNLDFYKTKKLNQMTQTEWEALCDGCGKCCFRKYISGRGKKTKLYLTRICCDFFDVKTGKCTDYQNRFEKCPECVRITPFNIEDFKWLPETCAYRLLSEGKELPPWHPLISGIPLRENPLCTNILIANPVLEKEVEFWEDFVIEEKSF